ncbi:MAG: alpha/beta fold hydrolase [Parvularculaceae bacterium]|nr:alpha/beta fold hydrolase [Parvularculaceae bacterium]
MLQRTHRIVANGLTHFVSDRGPIDGPASILLHGFPDSHALWDKTTPALTAAGFRVLAPDLRGFGETDMAASVADYDIETGAAPDVLALLDALGIYRAHLVGHDFGSPVAWALAATAPSRFQTLAALSVGHPKAYLAAGLEQKLRSLYIVYHQFVGLCEATYRAFDWALVRRNLSPNGDTEAAIRALARPGRLTAGLNWYRSNVSLSRIASGRSVFGAVGHVAIPTLGVWSRGEPYLVEAQMENSGLFVDAPWKYARIDGAGHWIPYDAPDALAALLLSHWRKA